MRLAKNFLLPAASCVAFSVLANAGTAYWWEAGNGNGLSKNYEFGAQEGNKTNWCADNNGDRSSWVAPFKYDTLDALRGNWDTVPTVDTKGTTIAEGADFKFGGDSTTVDVNYYYYVGGLMTSQWSGSADYTFNFGKSGAIYSRYQTKFDTAFKSLTINVDLSSAISDGAVHSRVLFGTSNSLGYSGFYRDMTVSDDFFRNATLSISGYTVKDGFFTDDNINTLNLSEGEAALVYSAANDTISVYYVSAAPEPSAFGLLAGLGALAIVAARRRRSRKA